MPAPLPSSDPCFDSPLPSIPTPTLGIEDSSTTGNLFNYLALPLTHPTTFTILFSAFFFILTVIPVTVYLSLTLARHRHHSTQLAAGEACDSEESRQNARQVSVWKVPFGSPIYYIDTAIRNVDVQKMEVEKDGL